MAKVEEAKVEEAKVEEGALAPVTRPEPDEPPLRVLFVCTANICRSPFMELIARKLAGPDAAVEFSSAGTHGFRDHPMDDVMAATLPEGVAHDAFRSRRLSSQLIAQADLVLTAETTHRGFILDDHPQLFRKVFTLGQFAQTVRSMEPGLTGRKLVASLSSRRGHAPAVLDVSDPYGRGPEAARASADKIEELLRIVVPALASTGRINA